MVLWLESYGFRVRAMVRVRCTPTMNHIDALPIGDPSLGANYP